MPLSALRRLATLACFGFVLSTSATAGVPSWTPIGLVVTDVYDVEVDPLDSSTVFVTTADGVRRSRNGGRTWRRVLGTGALPGENDRFFVAVDPRHSRTVYVNRGDRFARSVDGGDTWSVWTLSAACRTPPQDQRRSEDVTVAPTTPQRVGRPNVRETRRKSS